MIATEVWIDTASRPGLPVDTAALMQAMAQGFDLAGVTRISDTLVRFHNDAGLTLTLRGHVTEAGFVVTGAGLVQGDGQRLMSLRYAEGAPVIADQTDAGLLAGMIQQITALRADPAVRLSVSGAIGADVLTGGVGDDTLSGGNGNDVVVGGQGNDWVGGGWGRDTLAGWAGDDLLQGGGGRDVLTGGTGADRFQFRTATEAAADVITDFSHVQGDVIDFALIDAALVLSSDHTFHGVAGEVRLLVRSAGTFIQGDLDGDGLSDFSLLLRGVSDFQAADLYL